MRGPVQPVHALNGDGRAAFAFDLSAHPAQALRQIHNLRLSGSVLKHRRALCQCRCHQSVFRGPHRDERKLERAAFQAAGCFGMHIPFLKVKLCAHRFQGSEMKIHGSRTNRASARQRYNRMPRPREHGAQHEDRCPHLSNDVIFSPMIGDVMRRQCKDLAILHLTDLSPQTFEQKPHRANIRKPRCVGQGQRFLTQQRRRHQGKAGIFCARNRYVALQGTIASDQNCIHLV